MTSKIPTTFRKLVATKITQKFREAVQVCEVPMLKPGPQQVLVKTRFVGINASDINYTAGRYDQDIKVPFDVGFEGVGEVVATGENAAIRVGQAVGFMSMGAFSEYKVLGEREAIPLPEVDKNLIPFLVSGLTAAISLDKIGEIKKGETVLVTAAAGGTGQFAVQWAKNAGCHVIGTCSNDDKVQLLKDLGCDRPINYKKEDLKKVLKTEYPDGVDVVYESVGGHLFSTALKSLARRGRLIIIGLVSSYEKDTVALESSSRVEDLLAIPRILLGQSASIRGFFLLHHNNDIKPYFMKLAELYMSRKLKSFTDQGETISSGPFVGVDAVVDAVEYLYTGRSKGKVVVELNPESQSKL